MQHIIAQYPESGPLTTLFKTSGSLKLCIFLNRDKVYSFTSNRSLSLNYLLFIVYTIQRIVIMHMILNFFQVLECACVFGRGSALPSTLFFFSFNQNSLIHKKKKRSLQKELLKP